MKEKKQLKRRSELRNIGIGLTRNLKTKSVDISLGKITPVGLQAIVVVFVLQSGAEYSINDT